MKYTTLALLLVLAGCCPSRRPVTSGQQTPILMVAHVHEWIDHDPNGFTLVVKDGLNSGYYAGASLSGTTNTITVLGITEEVRAGKAPVMLVEIMSEAEPLELKYLGKPSDHYELIKSVK
jgi:hypothetical protein